MNSLPPLPSINVDHATINATSRIRQRSCINRPFTRKNVWTATALIVLISSFSDAFVTVSTPFRAERNIFPSYNDHALHASTTSTALLAVALPFTDAYTVSSPSILPSYTGNSLQSTTFASKITKDYERRKDEWARKYTSLPALRQTFGTNRNVLWGDLPANTTRRLYKTLLPRALLELHKLGVQPEDLAPLAYRARVAAKLYARERCSLPARIAANLYDGFRQWRRYGTFNTQGMTYQQVWNKYRKVILEDTNHVSDCSEEDSDCHGLTDQDVTAKICLKILERSCATNEMVDRLVLHNNYKGKNKRWTVDDAATDAELQEFTETLERDVRNLLAPVGSRPMDLDDAAYRSPAATALAVKRYHTLRKIVRIKRRLQLIQLHPPHRNE